MFDERFMTVVSKEGVVSIVSSSDDEAHVLIRGIPTWHFQVKTGFLYQFTE